MHCPHCCHRRHCQHSLSQAPPRPTLSLNRPLHSPLPPTHQPPATSPPSSRRLQPRTRQHPTGRAHTGLPGEPVEPHLVHTRIQNSPSRAVRPRPAPARLVAIHHPLATCPRILYSICVSLATGFPMLVACSAPVRSPAPAATHREPVKPPLFTPASRARRPSESVATSSNHAPIRQVEHFKPSYPRALNQPPKIRQSSRPGSPSPHWGLGLPGREYPHEPAALRPDKPPPQPLHHSPVRREPALGLSKEPALSLPKGNPLLAPRPQTPPKCTPPRLKSFLEKTLIAREALLQRPTPAGSDSLT